MCYTEKKSYFLKIITLTDHHNTLKLKLGVMPSEFELKFKVNNSFLKVNFPSHNIL